MIDGPPKVLPLYIDLHDHFVEVPAPSAGFDTFDPSFSDLRGEHRIEPVPPISDRFVADINTPFMKEI